MLDKKVPNTLLFKINFVSHSATQDEANNSLETVIFNLKEILGILDLRSIGY